MLLPIAIGIALTGQALGYIFLSAKKASKKDTASILHAKNKIATNHNSGKAKLCTFATNN
jgi:hypothetical protein